MSKPYLRRLGAFCFLWIPLAGPALADDEEKDNAGQVWAGKEATEDEEEARRAQRLTSAQVRASKKAGAGFRYGNVFFDPHALGLEGFANFQPPNYQIGGDFQYAQQNLVGSLEEEPMTDVGELKLKRQQLVVFARYFIRPELYLAAGLGYRRTTVTWEAHERLGTGTVSGKSKTDSYLLDLRIGQQWAFKGGWYVTFEPVEYTARFASKTRHAEDRGGSASNEVDETLSGLHQRGELEGKRPTWEFFNLCAGKMF